ncbi:hypothetical protein CLV48_101550 [Cecembia rubra]|uniref:Uncharacterized protein n=1 Tax=Cecembia rubra TaxID=1485585 RepID=A0A2P8EDV7_9BACT|nr:hypothetical protein CLV48_101550 [Cecembia rubra]
MKRRPGLGMKSTGETDQGSLVMSQAFFVDVDKIVII